MRYYLLFALQITLIYQTAGQNISSILNEFNQDSLVKTVRELSGEDSVVINGTKTIIKNRAAYLGFNLTENYLKERLAKYNLIVETYKYSINGLNIFGIQKGTKFPDETFIVGAHHDAVTSYCADDNASGVAAVLETARVLSEISLDYTVIYAFWDEEEAGLWGSTYHAKQAKANGQTFRGIVNLDMIGYDSNNDRKFDIHVYPDASSLSLVDSTLNVISRYKLNLDPQVINPGTDRGDHYSYWKQGIYNAIAYGERIFTDDPNPAYHSENDRINLFNIPYFAEISKMTVGLMATLARPSVTGISEKTESLSDIEIFPNPTNGIITIDLKNNLETKVIITNIFGRVLTKKSYQKPLITFDLNDFPDGFYMVSVINKKGIFTRKIIKSH
jgi:hypothetical protein